MHVASISKFKLLALAAIFSLATMGVTSAETPKADYIPTKENLEARKWFQDAKFGIFIHWGVYSLMAGAGEEGIAEWVMQNKKISIKNYERLPTYFNPVKFNADEWVKSFKSAGAKYITITTKHHDGFAMYDSKASDYDVVESTPFARDILKELKAACDKHGMKLFFYYSQLDWHHTDYYPRGRTGNDYTGRPEKGDWNKYIDYQNAQLRELLTNYGDIGGFWFDGWWDQKNTSLKDSWRLEETYEMIHELQPHALVINNHHVEPFAGEDVQPFEQDLPGENSAGFNTTFISNAMPLETAMTMNGSWGYNLIDNNFKSTRELIQTLVGAAGRNSNFLMNTGPLPDGRIQPENVQTYKEMGVWMEQYGESIYGTRGGPVGVRPWGVTTQKDNTVYVHVMNWENSQLRLDSKGLDVKKATVLRNGAKVDFTSTDKGIILDIPEEELKEWDAVIKLELK